jgi:Tfp pilus assembly protein PilO
MKGLRTTAKIFLVFTIVFAAAYQFLVLPQVKATSVALGELEDLRMQQSAGLSAKQRTELLQEAQVTREEALRLMPATDEQYDLSVQVEALAQESGVSITTLALHAAAPTTLNPTTPPAEGEGPTAATSPAQPASGVLKVLVSVSVTGSYTNVQTFVSELPSIGRFLQIDQLVLNVKDGQVAAQVVANAFYMPLKK